MLTWNPYLESWLRIPYNSSMQADRISALLRPFLERPPSPSQLEQVSIYIDMLLRWNARINLTAIRNSDEIVTRHFGESFFLARHLFPDVGPGGVTKEQFHQGGAGTKDAMQLPHASLSITRALDIGSGAGWPGLPLKIWAPTIHLALVESNAKKAAFLREVGRALGLAQVVVLNERTEALIKRNDLIQNDVVTFRAVEHFEEILGQAMSFLVPGGRVAVLIGASQVHSLERRSNIQWSAPVAVPNSETRVLCIGQIR
jgi:16S rRNA (guanine527-N7)-methyltransferase